MSVRDFRFVADEFSKGLRVFDEVECFAPQNHMKDQILRNGFEWHVPSEI